MPPFESVLFDLDGTLTDSFEGIANCLRHTLRTMGEPVPEAADLAWCVGPPIHRSFATLVGAERALEAVEIYRERFARVGWQENRRYPGIPATLAALKKSGLRLFVATSKAEVYVPRILERFDLAGYFQGAYGSGLDGTRDDKAELIAHVLQTEGLDPETTAMVGDRSYDMAGALANRVRGVGVLWGYGSAAELNDAGAWALAESPENLASLLAPSPSQSK